MYKLFVKIDGYTYRLLAEADKLEDLEIPLAAQLNPWKIEKDGEIVDQSKAMNRFSPCIFCGAPALMKYKHYAHLCKCSKCSKVFDDRPERRKRDKSNDPDGTDGQRAA